MTKISSVTWTTKSGEKRTAYRFTYLVAGKKKFKQFTTERAASRAVRRLESTIAIETAEFTSSKTPTVSSFAKTWLKACEVGRLGEPPLEPETIVGYKGYVDNWIDQLPIGEDQQPIGDMKLGSVKRRDVVNFRAALLESHVSRITARKILTVLRSIFDYAVQKEEIEADPTYKISIKIGARHRTHIPIHSKKSMAKIVTLAYELSQSTNKQTERTWMRYSLMLELLVYCGLRLSELRGLPRTACDFKHAKLSITQRADRNGRIGPPKSARGRRTLYMPDRLVPRLKAWLQTHNHELVFPSRTGHPLFPENIRKRMWEHIQLAADVPCYTIHSARHFFASRLIENGCTPKELSTDMGHADEAFTFRVYGHLFRDEESEKRRRERSNDLVLPGS
jgi:integrase